MQRALSACYDCSHTTAGGYERLAEARAQALADEARGDIRSASGWKSDDQPEWLRWPSLAERRLRDQRSEQTGKKA
jgi:hypothetical protein